MRLPPGSARYPTSYPAGEFRAEIPRHQASSASAAITSKTVSGDYSSDVGSNPTPSVRPVRG
jgi:hypothetical protein